MSPSEPELGAYNSRLTPAVFDFMVRVIYWPTRIADVRGRIVELLELHENTTVLEPGAGTGGLTRLMVDAGARVTVVDRAPIMLERLRARVPEATVVVGPAAEFQSVERFDRVLLALFLHEQTSADRVRILRMARTHLAPGGRVVVADTFAPAGAFARTLWRAFLRTFEPATVVEVADGALAAEIEQAGLEIRHHESLANGRLCVWVAS
jgi:SAM-dependent methyltransferase